MVSTFKHMRFAGLSPDVMAKLLSSGGAAVLASSAVFPSGARSFVAPAERFQMVPGTGVFLWQQKHENPKSCQT